jgi:hypothetical protein
MGVVTACDTWLQMQQASLHGFRALEVMRTAAVAERSGALLLNAVGRALSAHIHTITVARVADAPGGEQGAGAEC